MPWNWRGTSKVMGLGSRQAARHRPGLHSWRSSRPGGCLHVIRAWACTTLLHQRADQGLGTSDAWPGPVGRSNRCAAALCGNSRWPRGGYADLQESGYIDHFFVAAEFSGQGVGSLLMQRIHEAASQRHIAILFADVGLTAEAFFQHRGFAVVSCQSVRTWPYRMPG